MIVAIVFDSRKYDDDLVGNFVVCVWWIFVSFWNDNEKFALG